MRSESELVARVSVPHPQGLSRTWAKCRVKVGGICRVSAIRAAWSLGKQRTTVPKVFMSSSTVRLVGLCHIRQPNYQYWRVTPTTSGVEASLCQHDLKISCVTWQHIVNCSFIIYVRLGYWLIACLATWPHLVTLTILYTWKLWFFQRKFTELLICFKKCKGYIRL